MQNSMIDLSWLQNMVNQSICGKPSEATKVENDIQQHALNQKKRGNIQRTRSRVHQDPGSDVMYELQ